MTPNLSITAGVRYDWNGGLTEKNGNIFNFDPIALQLRRRRPDTITSSGFIIAGNNKNGTSGVSKTTLTGRQWGIAPRLGLAWQPHAFHSKSWSAAGGGFYYDRGELFTYLSPGYAAGEIDGGPFGIVQTRPSSPSSTARTASSYNAADPTYLYLYYIPICGGNGFTGSVDNSEYNLATPWGPTSGSGPSNPKASDISNYLPNASRDYRRHGLYQRTASLYSRRLQPRQQTALQHQLHAQHPVPAAQRPDVRDRLRGQSRPPPDDSGAL